MKEKGYYQLKDINEKLAKKVRKQRKIIKYLRKELERKEGQLIQYHQELLKSNAIIEELKTELESLNKWRLINKLRKSMPNSFKKINSYLKLLYLYIVHFIVAIYIEFWERKHKSKIFPGR